MIEIEKKEGTGLKSKCGEIIVKMTKKKYNWNLFITFFMGCLIGFSFTYLAMLEDNLYFIKDISQRTDNIIELTKDVRDAERYVCELKLENQLIQSEYYCKIRGYVIE